MKKFKIDLFKVLVAVHFGPYWEAIADLEKWLGGEIDVYDESIAFVVAGCRRVGIGLGPDIKECDIYHEAYHATNKLLESIGAKGEEEINAHIQTSMDSPD